MKKKIAVVGCGKIFFKHYEAIKIQEKKGNLKLVAICDVNKKALNLINIKKINKYNKISDMLNKEAIDIVSILTPSGFHFNHAMPFAGKVNSVIIEKPLTLKLSDANKMIQYFKKKKTKLFVVLQNRFNESILTLKNAIDKNLLGDIFLVTVRLRWSRGLRYYSQSKWRGTWKLDGGVIANQSSHFIDLFQWLFGMPKNVFSRIRQMRKIKEVEDTALAMFEYKKKNKLGLIEATNAIYPKNLEGSLSVIGKKGSVVVGGINGEKIINWTIKKNSRVKKILNKKKFTKNLHIKFYESVIKVLNKKIKKNFLSGDEGIKSLKIINSIYASSKKNNPINLKAVNKSFLGTGIKKVL